MLSVAATAIAGSLVLLPPVEEGLPSSAAAGATNAVYASSSAMASAVMAGAANGEFFPSTFTAASTLRSVGAKLFAKSSAYKTEAESDNKPSMCDLTASSELRSSAGVMGAI